LREHPAFQAAFPNRQTTLSGFADGCTQAARSALCHSVATHLGECRRRGASNMFFHDRFAAGEELAKHLAPYRHRRDVLVLALPRGGVPVAYEVAKALEAPLDVFLVGKLGVPGHEELAMGAVASGGVRTLNRDVVGPLRIPKHVIEYVVQNELAEIERQQLT
jgi:hypothetical protein